MKTKRAMQRWPYTKGLHDLGDGCYAYLQPDGTWGYSNAGLIVDSGESLLVDTLMDLKLTREMLDHMRAAEPSAASIGTLVNTHSNPDHTNGNQLIANAQIIASTACLEEMKEQSSAHRYPMTGEAGAFFQEVLSSRFDFSGIQPALPSRTFDRELALNVGSKEVRLFELGPAHTRGDIVAFVPADKTVFTGDILFAGGHPVIWEGPIGNWIRACDRILAWDVETVVPGHGPITDKSGVRALKRYLEYVRDESRKRFDAGMGYEEAARDIVLGTFSDWTDPERVVVNVYACYREFRSETERLPLPVLFGSMARYRNGRKNQETGRGPR
ncbi:MAG TPA: MBL fold metallo-hydrolase [Candidatus Dormibacteraeota bacterium]|nr:MBL fold metallo-hydrolase [Candidatus Dormibacteraeota bacterium]